MNKLFKVLSTTLLIFTIVSAFAFTPGTSLNKEIDVCAIQGVSCVRNIGDCPVGSLQWDTVSEPSPPVPLLNFSQDNILRFLSEIKRITNNSDVVCFDSNFFGTVIKFTEIRNGPSNDFIVYDQNLLNKEVARVCPSNTVIARLEQYVGCCPVGADNLVPVASIRGDASEWSINAQASSRDINSFVACCPNGYNYYTKEPEIGFGFFQSHECVDFSFTRNNFVGVVNRSISALSYQSNLSGNGITGLNVFPSSSPIGANWICPDPSYSCVTFKNGVGANIQSPMNASDLSNPGGQQFNDQCDRCYKDGSVMGVDPATAQILICNGSNPQTPNQMSPVNNSVSDTLACLRSPGGVQGSIFLQCKSCRESGGVWTGLGCQDTSPTGMITWIIRVAYGVMGGVALIQFIIAGIYYQTGQEDKVREARKGIMATITGLAVLTFSILILRIIGVNILDILPIGTI